MSTNNPFRTPLGHSETKPIDTKVKLMTFDGKEDVLSLPKFVATLKLQMVTQQAITDAEKIAFFAQHLTGNAVTWALNWVDEPPTDATWENFIKDFESHYTSKIDIHKLLNFIHNINEASIGIERYNASYRRLIALLPKDLWSEKAILAQYARNLSPTTYERIAAAEPSTLKKAMVIAYETIPIQSREFSTGTQQSFNLPMGTQQSRMTPVLGINQVMAYNQTNDLNEYTISAVQRRGLISREECIQKNQCFNYKKPGHRLDQCRTRPAGPNPNHY
ncbi:hypothetical protein TBLA_0A07940 [Henningerozyma blattae CBS 6284]|uniref:Ty3 transposon capsid-like protein domain-containing protein n=1 Tax=Henningerozyma blattae (strain ATCC 34711 / CBS 6284 / DSM 70876 / NBRC 10599 / NRRL Y-10934 / UCD 77-7) TaxID=1071380 RepID=I2GWT2_HENB6|nr:hypothetical protein TBLA_0A07940 [Tetrapisispora blattae CBS 6284]CCH58584.1 hypothetical protein TBLA_0A07940 [Tetrapisispora blattae CBS 6284]